MMIKMLLEEADQYFYCESRRAGPHSFEGVVHFLHKVGDGNAFVRAKTYTVKTSFESRHDALTAAERYGRQIARSLRTAVESAEDDGAYGADSRTPVHKRDTCMEKPAR